MNLELAKRINEREDMIEGIVARAFRRAGFRDANLISEAASEVIMHLYANVATNDRYVTYCATVEKFNGWLKMIVLRECQKIGERLATKATKGAQSLNVSGLMEGDNGTESAGDGSLPLGTMQDPERIVLRRESAERMYDAIAQLEDLERQVIRLVADERQGIEIAESLGISPVQVSRIKKRAFGKIQANMAEA